MLGRRPRPDSTGVLFDQRLAGARWLGRMPSLVSFRYQVIVVADPHAAEPLTTPHAQT